MNMPIVKLLPPESGNPFDIRMDTSAIKRKYLNIDYTPGNPHPMRLLDLYLPNEGDGLFPVLICMHGGGFTGGKKDDFQIAPFLEAVAEGFAVASVEQRLCNLLPDGTHNPEGIFPNPLFDFKAAIRFLRANAGTYNLDTNRFAVCGGSAGGYHAVMAAMTQDVPAMYDNSLGFADVSGRVHAVVDWYGVSDFVLLSEVSRDAVIKLPDGTEMKRENHADMFLGIDCVKNPKLAFFANPAAWVTHSCPPVLLQAGTADEMVPVESSRRLAARIAGVCGKDHVDFDEFPEYTHGDMRFNDPANMLRVFEWLRGVLGM